MPLRHPSNPPGGAAFGPEGGEGDPFRGAARGPGGRDRGRRTLGREDVVFLAMRPTCRAGHTACSSTARNGWQSRQTSLPGVGEPRRDKRGAAAAGERPCRGGGNPSPRGDLVSTSGGGRGAGTARASVRPSVLREKCWSVSGAAAAFGGRSWGRKCTSERERAEGLSFGKCVRRKPIGASRSIRGEKGRLPRDPPRKTPGARGSDSSPPPGIG